MAKTRNEVEIPITAKDNASKQLKAIRGELNQTASAASALGGSSIVGAKGLKGLGAVVGGLASPIGLATAGIAGMVSLFNKWREAQSESNRTAFDESLKQQTSAWKANTSEIKENIETLERYNRNAKASGGTGQSIIPLLKEESENIVRQRQALEARITKLNKSYANSENVGTTVAGVMFKADDKEIKRRNDALRTELAKLEQDQLDNRKRVRIEEENAETDKAKKIREGFDKEMKAARAVSDRNIDNIDREIDLLNKRNAIAAGRGKKTESAEGLFEQRGKEIERQLHDAQAYFDQASREAKNNPDDGNAKHRLEARTEELLRLAELHKKHYQELEDYQLEYNAKREDADIKAFEKAKKAAAKFFDDVKKAADKNADDLKKSRDKVIASAAEAADAATEKLNKLTNPTEQRRAVRRVEKEDRKEERYRQNQIERANRAVAKGGGTERQREIAKTWREQADANGAGLQAQQSKTEEDMLEELKDINKNITSTMSLGGA